MNRQNYEKYWKITLGYTDIFSEPFNKTLNVIVHFIDENTSTKYSKDKYKSLQEKIHFIYQKNDASVRKDINTYVKLGFINLKLESYHLDTLAFLRESNKERKKSIFSKIVYSNSSFDRSVTNSSDKKEINFLIKTLEQIGKLNKTEILALMTVDISTIHKGYLTKKELESAVNYAQTIKFNERKYNQKGHLWSVLKLLDDLKIINDTLYFEDKAQDVTVKIYAEKRDPYLQRIYKNQLREESKNDLGEPECMVEHISYPYLIASHIKPFVSCSQTEAYDSNNGLLLSKNIDIIFDQGDVSFKNNGSIILSKRLSIKLKDRLKNYSLDKKYLNEKRLNYLKYHRSNVFK